MGHFFRPMHHCLLGPPCTIIRLLEMLNYAWDWDWEGVMQAGPDTLSILMSSPFVDSQEVPAEVPEPALGINFARDGMQRKDWLGLVAVHSDAWLMALAFYKGARLDSEER